MSVNLQSDAAKIVCVEAPALAAAADPSYPYYESKRIPTRLPLDTWGHIGTFLTPRDMGSLATICQDARDGVSNNSVPGLRNNELEKVRSLVTKLSNVFPQLNVEKSAEKYVLNAYISRLTRAKYLSDINNPLTDIYKHILRMTSEKSEESFLEKRRVLSWVVFILYQAHKEGNLPHLQQHLLYELETKLYHLFSELNLRVWDSITGLIPGANPIAIPLLEIEGKTHAAFTHAIYRLNPENLPMLHYSELDNAKSTKYKEEFQNEDTTLNRLKRYAKYGNQKNDLIYVIKVLSLYSLSFYGLYYCMVSGRPGMPSES